MHRLILVTMVVAITSLIALGCNSNAEELAAAWNREFKHEVGPRATREAVLQFLRARELPPHIDSRRHIVTASRRDTDRNGPVSSGVYLTFYFDDQDLLLKYDIRAVHTGP